MNSQEDTTVNQQTKENIQAIKSVEDSFHSERTFGQRMADGVAKVLGSWGFILIQSCLLIIWIIINTFGSDKLRWDAYPFILLNLGLSLQAAFASPIIMMSQNRQAALDQKRNKLDLQINLLSEQEGTEMLRLLRKLCEHNGLDLSEHQRAAVLSNATEISTLSKDLDKIEDKK